MLSLTVFFSSILSRSWPFRQSGEKPEHPLLAQSREYFASLDLGKPLQEYDFVVLDTELTGLKVNKDEIVSIGAVRIREMRIDIQESLYYCVCPTREVPKQSVLVHGITPAQASKAPPLKDVFLKLLEYCGNSVIIGHNINLDMGVINRCLQQNFRGVLYNLCVDTMRLARVYQERHWAGAPEGFNIARSYNLKALSQEFNLPLFPEHNAFNDALQTAYLFLFLVHKLQSSSTWTLNGLKRVGGSRKWGVV